MLRKLAFNTLISAGGLLFTNLVTLFLVPFLVHHYGVAQYGLITLLRMFLPAAAFSLFDFGFSETSTQAIVRARSGGDWPSAMRHVACVGVIAAGTGIAVAFLLALAAPHLAILFKAPPDGARGFERLILATALAFMPLLAGLMLDGVVKGFEAFPALRAVEIVSALVYAGSAVALAYGGFGYAWIGGAYVASQLLRTLLLGVVAWRKLRGVDAKIFWPAGEWGDVMRRSRIMAASKWLGMAQNQLPPLLIGLVLGPASAGIYDIVVRIPRVVKTAIGLLNTAVLPVAARLEAEGGGMRQLGELGLLAMATASIPICAAGMVFSAPILSLWVGPQFAGFAPWQATAFTMPILNSLVSFGGQMMLVRPHVTGKINQVVFAQLIIQYSLSLALIGSFSERAFILGQALAVIATFWAQTWILSREKGMDVSAYYRPLAIAGVTALLSGMSVALGVPAKIGTMGHLVAVLCAWMMLHYAALWWVILVSKERRQIMRTISGK